jgi:peptidoglycan hydrolase-like protein with peptidoglycan-binding domain
MTAAKKLTSVNTGACVEVGRVERIADDVLHVRLGGGTYPPVRARRAKSCLVAPEIGDKVLCAVDGDGIFVVAVLEGRDSAPTQIAVEGDLQIRSRSGRVAVGAPQGVALVSSSDVSVSAREVNVRAPKGSVAIDDLGGFGRLVQAQVIKVTLAAKEIDTIAERLSQRVKRAFRFVEDIDQTRAGTVDLRAEKMIGIRGENAVIAARVLAKVDGEQIHIG